MSKQIFSKEIPPACKYCVFGTPAPITDEILCRRKGVVAPEGHCRRYKYDVLKRVPRVGPALQSFCEADFEL